MKALTISSILLSVLLFNFKANALLLEPLISYENGVVDYEFTPGLTAKDHHSGFLLGARVGTDVLGLFFTALDYRQGSISLDTSGDGTRTVMGIVVGADLPLVRAWAGYNFQDDVKATFNSTERTIEGSSLKAGAGFSFIPFVEVSLEYFLMSKGDEKDESYMLTISAPFDL